MRESERVIEKGRERKRARVSERARDREKERGGGGSEGGGLKQEQSDTLHCQTDRSPGKHERTHKTTSTQTNI